jgi:hypothetical protein
VRRYTLRLPAVEEDSPWGDTVIKVRHAIAGRIGDCHGGLVAALERRGYSAPLHASLREHPRRETADR